MDDFSASIMSVLDVKEFRTTATIAHFLCAGSRLSYESCRSKVWTYCKVLADMGLIEG